jgi:predicted nucleotidyltransferase
LVSQLVSLGFIQRVEPKQVKPDEDDREWYTLTELGVSLSLASAAKRITRETAERVINEFMKRVATVNLEDRFYYRITSVLVYGSYVRDVVDLGDVDFAIQLKPRIANATHEEGFRLIRKKIDEARFAGRRFRNLTDEVVWPEMEVRLFLKNKKRSVSIHLLEELKYLSRKRRLDYRVLLGNEADIAKELGLPLVKS